MLMTAQYWRNLKSNPAYGGMSPDDSEQAYGGDAGVGNNLHPSGFLSAASPGESKFSGSGPATGSGTNDIQGGSYWLNHLSLPAQAKFNAYLNQGSQQGGSPSMPTAMQLYPWLFNAGLAFNPHQTMLNRLRPSSGVQFSPIR